jgi:hypothetical protein
LFDALRIAPHDLPVRDKCVDYRQFFLSLLGTGSDASFEKC